MTSSAIRQSFLDFFREKGHTIVPSSPLLPDAPNLLFTNAGMNQFVPIFLGQTPAPQPPRIADTQKCIRAGGKHNDLEDVGFDTYHHTFFEMLGNWSFGDYFKKEAIAWAWELVVGRWKFPASRLYATIYQPGAGDPASFDQEAYDHWAAVFTAAGLDPAIHIVNGNKKDNFWMMGDTGPCGPCSELHVDLTPGAPELSLERQKAGRELVNKGDARCIEIWNLVFIQFNANPDGTFGPLPAKHVDTGMGFERVVSMVQGTKGLTDFSANAKISNYETDVFRPIFDELEKLTGKKYGSTLPASAQNETEQEKIDVAFRVIADHIRTLSFSIADGIQPSNEGRGYVLRRILRRAVSYGNNIGFKRPFLAELVDTLGRTMGHIFPEVVNKADLIKKTLTAEEESFFRNLDRGLELFELFAQLRPVTIGNRKFYPRQRPVSPGSEEREFIITGEVAFLLYDTYGFPLDLTQLKARERGWAVDVDEFDLLMAEQKAKGQAAQKKEQIKVDIGYGDSSKKTEFVGYEKLEIEEPLAGTTVGHTGDVAESHSTVFSVYFDKTVFYAEMGGQVGDAGEIEYGGTIYRVRDTQKSSILPIVLHVIEGKKDIFLAPGTPATLRVDAPRRHKIEAHHSGTHLLNWALRKVLGNTITQKGSYVGPDRLRFDFSHGAAMTPAELAEVERLVNEKIAEDAAVAWDERPYAQVKGDPSILQFFGDKYGETVRVVAIGDFSKELCGGTHVKHTAQIGTFKILHESAIAAGIRRIEAASGDALKEHIKILLQKQEVTYSELRVRKSDLPASLTQMISPTIESRHYTEDKFDGNFRADILWNFYAIREAELERAQAEVAQHEKEAAKQQEAMFQKRAAETAPDLIGAASDVNGVPFLAVEIDGAPAAYLPFLADALKTRWQGVAVLATIDQGKVALLAAVAPAFTKKIQAGKIIQAIAPLVGGKGGGRPELAQGGGTNPDGVAVALAKAEELIRAS